MIDDSDHLTRTSGEVYGEDEITLGQLKVKFDELSVEHHLEDLLSLILVVDCHNVQVVDGSGVLERFLNWLIVNLLLSHGSVVDLGSLPVTLKVKIARLEQLNGSIPLHSDNLECINLESIFIIFGLAETV